jgi:Zn-dependent alcohol dehydrogenase
VAQGIIDSNTWSDSYTGIVKQAGSGVSGLSVGDTVVCLQPANFGNFIRTKEYLCRKLSDGDSLIVGFHPLMTARLIE